MLLRSGGGVHSKRIESARESSRELDRLTCVERHWADALVYVASHLSKRR